MSFSAACSGVGRCRLFCVRMSRIVAKSGVSGKVLPAIDQVAEVFGRSPVDLTRLVDHAPESDGRSWVGLTRPVIHAPE